MRFLTTLILVMFTFNTQAYAQGIPVYDAASFAQFITQLDKMAQDYQKQLEQLQEATRQTQALTGTRGMGSLVNGDFERSLRQYVPDDWSQTMQLLDAGNLPPGALGTQNIYSQLYNDYAPISGSDFISGDPSGPVAQSLDRRTATTYAAMAASEQAFNNISARMQTYETLLEELNNTDDLKASLDLQARITAENGLILSELMRLSTIQTQLRASAGNEDLVNYRRSATANQYNPDQARDAMRLPE